MGEDDWVAALDTFKKYTKTNLDELDYYQLLHDLNDPPNRESDRSVIVILGSLIDDRLEMAIREKLGPLEADEEAELKLFDFGGPLGTLSFRTGVARALGVIDARTKKRIDDIRKIRNGCAHTIAPIRFDIPKVANVCKRFVASSVADVFLPPSDKASKEDQAKWLRLAFMLACIYVIAAIDKKTTQAAMRFTKDLGKKFADDLKLRS